MSKGLTQSQFYMWRALFALVHADHMVTNEEVRFMAEALEDVPFSADQRAVLMEDIHTAQNIEEMFTRISDPLDQAKFFRFAHNVVHADGDYGDAEQKIMLKLEELHVKNTDVADLVGKVELSFENDEDAKARVEKLKDSKKIAFAFREDFLKGFEGKN